ncbi:MAG: hypothetical protein IJO88_00620 [Oscillospiraceae bacterium]|nr:hypothetical protein [Oscillospiraceae bacterium]
MDKQKCISKVAKTDEERIFYARLYDRLVGAEQKNIPASTNFLTAAEQVLLRQMLAPLELTFFGGCAGAERAVACWLPEYLDESWLMEEPPIAAVRAEFFEKDALTHRDILGGLMGIGIKRETVGDIYVGKGRCDFFVTCEILPYVMDNLLSAGRTKLHLEQIGFDAVEVPPITVKEIRDTVPSLRLDSIVGSGFSMARGKACDLIAAGKVSVNDLPTLKADKLLSEGDKISARGFGKFVLRQVGGRTKKDRISIVIEAYR